MFLKCNKIDWEFDWWIGQKHELQVYMTSTIVYWKTLVLVLDLVTKTKLNQGLKFN